MDRLSRRGIIFILSGPSGAGKSTIAKEVAQRLGYLYIDTGAMHRAVGLKALQLNPQLEDVSKIVTVAATSRIELRDDHGLLRVLLDGSDVTEAIRSPEENRRSA